MSVILHYVQEKRGVYGQAIGQLFLPGFSGRSRMNRDQGVNNSKGGGWMKLKVEKLEEKIAPAGISQGGQLFMLPPG